MITSGIMMAASAGAQIYSIEEQAKASRKVGRAQEKANAIEERRAMLMNQAERKKASAMLNMQQQQNISMGISSGGGGLGSNVLGANIGLGSSFASETGMSNTMLASNVARAQALQQGANAAAVHQNRAAWGGAVANTSGSVAAMAFSKV
mgnify:FL=1